MLPNLDFAGMDAGEPEIDVNEKTAKKKLFIKEENEEETLKNLNNYITKDFNCEMESFGENSKKTSESNLQIVNRKQTAITLKSESFD